jgi:ParB-like chromosome segregation protein Spo0J
MKTEKIKITGVKNNPENPRVIKDEKFDKLVQSIKDFPEMLEIRPIVVNEKLIILGGNMRFQAAKEAGLKMIHVIKVALSEEKQREFVIKDNASFGEWDWEELETDFTVQELTDWGVDVKKKKEKKKQLLFSIVCSSHDERDQLKDMLDTEKNRMRYSEYVEIKKK